MTSFDDVTIRPLCAEDAAGYFHLLNNNRDRIARYFPKTTASVQTLESTQEHIAECLDRTQKSMYFNFAMISSTDALIGALIIKDIDWHTSKCDM